MCSSCSRARASRATLAWRENPSRRAHRSFSPSITAAAVRRACILNAVALARLARSARSPRDGARRRVEFEYVSDVLDVWESGGVARLRRFLFALAVEIP